MLNRLARETLEHAFPLSWVSGEISNLTRAASGHIYFSLKDEAAQVRCVMFRNRAQMLPFQLSNGLQVEARALVTLYEARGDFQLNVENLRRAGLGALFEAFERLKAKLAGEGLFEAAAKRPLPRFPRRIGVITSLQAAALRDVLAALARRAPHVPLRIHPVPVQGEGAAAHIAKALRQADSGECDVLILARGGGSIEDLWAFNDEQLARAIAASSTPVISGIGHETDFTITDFVADMRAATPTAAAEMASSGWFTAAADLRALHHRLQAAMQRGHAQRVQQLDLAGQRLSHPAQRMREARARLEQLGARLRMMQSHALERRQSGLTALRQRLLSASPSLPLRAAQIDGLRHRLQRAWRQELLRQQATLARMAGAIGHLSPQATLERGYSITFDAHGEIVRDAARLTAGDRLDIRFARGSTRASVQSDD